MNEYQTKIISTLNVEKHVVQIHNVSYGLELELQKGVTWIL